MDTILRWTLLLLIVAFIRTAVTTDTIGCYAIGPGWYQQAYNNGTSIEDTALLSCLQACHQNNSTFAGVKKYNQSQVVLDCYCGNELTGAASYSCHQRCGEHSCGSPSGDISVYPVCTPGQYGSDCSLQCPDSCSSTLCDISSGACVNSRCGSIVTDTCLGSCRGGLCNACGECWLGCEAGFYTRHCTQECPDNCAYETCDDNGECLNGCEAEYYGASCTERCPDNCAYGTCDFQGQCIEGCDSGYYTLNCSQRCPQNCRDLKCDRNGECVYGCRKGYYSEMCEEACPDNCADMLCDSGGHCLLGCDYGYYAATCDKECPKSCVELLCDRHGDCTQGCIPGYYTANCSEQCPESCQGRACTAQGHCAEPNYDTDPPPWIIPVAILLFLSGGAIGMAAVSLCRCPGGKTSGKLATNPTVDGEPCAPEEIQNSYTRTLPSDGELDPRYYERIYNARASCETVRKSFRGTIPNWDYNDDRDDSIAVISIDVDQTTCKQVGCPPARLEDIYQSLEVDV